MKPAAEPLADQERIDRGKATIRKLVSRLTATLMKRVPGATPGGLTTAINRRKKAEAGPLVDNLDILRRHYMWLRRLETQLEDGPVPDYLIPEENKT
ncbi:hypothetical protein MRB56_14170 [Halomonas cupida]|uniref:hypothetical protein n=1 Tax=Halomonas cupida TaxID=44933 RepID=UPI0039B3DED0